MSRQSGFSLPRSCNSSSRLSFTGMVIHVSRFTNMRCSRPQAPPRRPLLRAKPNVLLARSSGRVRHGQQRLDRPRVPRSGLSFILRPFGPAYQILPSQPFPFAVPHHLVSPRHSLVILYHLAQKRAL